MVSCSSKQVRLDVNDNAKIFSIENIKDYPPPPVSGEPDGQTPGVAAPSDEEVGAILHGIIAGDTLIS